LEYLIDFTIDIPDGTPATDVDQRAQAEADRVGVLATEGHVCASGAQRLTTAAGGRSVFIEPTMKRS